MSKWGLCCSASGEVWGIDASGSKYVLVNVDPVLIEIDPKYALSQVETALAFHSLC